MESKPTPLMTIGGKTVFLQLSSEGREVVTFTSGATIDADGSPRAYHPQGKPGLDYLENAGRPGNWWGIATRRGSPVIQGKDDPAPGFYVSTTAYMHRGEPAWSPRAYLDSETVPFIVVPGPLRGMVDGVVLGCLAQVKNRANGRKCDCVVGDIGPAKHLGEISIAAAKLLGLPTNARKGGGAASGIEYTIYPGISPIIDGKAYRLIPA